MKLDAAWPLTIYYDAACPLCEREIGTLASCDLNSRLRLIDCSPLDFVDVHATAAGLDRQDFMRAIHARDATGRWYRGIDVFALAYQAAGMTGVARVFAHPRLRPFWDWLYPHIAKHRMLLSRFGVTDLYGWLIVQGSRPTPRLSSSAK
jgi:predicted DCC family thiol-disulfide oxidoreductase YuxK